MTTCLLLDVIYYIILLYELEIHEGGIENVPHLGGSLA